MDKKFICYCGLYCENCAVKAKIDPAAENLHKEMEKAGLGKIINFIPGGGDFWRFLTDMAHRGFCTSCVEGGGNPGCTVRKCAKENGVQTCALCESYPCEKIEKFFAGYFMLKEDNLLFREKGVDAWAKLQDERHAGGFTYTDANKGV